MEKETRQRKPYQRVQCKLITYGRDSVMFAVSWSDKCGLSPLGIAMIKNREYVRSLSLQERNNYYNNLPTYVFADGNPDYICWGVTLQNPQGGFFYWPGEECAMNTPFYQSLPDNGELINLCEKYGISISKDNGSNYPSTSNYVC